MHFLSVSKFSEDLNQQLVILKLLTLLSKECSDILMNHMRKKICKNPLRSQLKTVPKMPLCPRSVFTVSPRSLHVISNHVLTKGNSGVLDRKLLTMKFIGQMQHLIFKESNNDDYPVTHLQHLHSLRCVRTQMWSSHMLRF